MRPGVVIVSPAEVMGVSVCHFPSAGLIVIDRPHIMWDVNIVKDYFFILLTKADKIALSTLGVYHGCR